MGIVVPRIDWLNATTAPPLAADEAHVWELPMEATDEQQRQHLRHLSLDEQQQAVRFVRPELTRRFIMRRSRMRLVLAQYLADPSAPVVFRWNRFGKPYLDGDAHDTTELLFNTSQSHETALMAVCRGREIGVDVEHVRPISDFIQLGQRFFTESEQRTILAQPVSQRLSAFFWIWTGKEAILKACGIGISTGLRRATIGLQPSGPHLDLLDDELGDAASWLFHAFVPRDEYLATLATSASVDVIRYLRWNTP